MAVFKFAPPAGVKLPASGKAEIRFPTKSGRDSIEASPGDEFTITDPQAIKALKGHDYIQLVSA
jgi:hypothetical protein